MDTAPYLPAFLLCEKATQNPDNSISITKIIDKFLTNPKHRIDGPPYLMKAVIFAALTTDGASVTGPFSISIEPPNQARELFMQNTITIPGSGDGANIIVNFEYGAPRFGMYVLYFEFRGKELGKRSFRIAAPQPDIDTSHSQKPS